MGPADEPAPPWVALPGLSPDEPANQGAAEAYIVLEFLPFWMTLTKDQKAEYLDRWNASQDWREAIAFKFDHEGFDAEEDARDAEAGRLSHPLPPKKPWWAFWRS